MKEKNFVNRLYCWNKMVHFFLTTTDLYAHEEEYVLDNCSQQSEKLLLGDKQIFVRLFCSCVQPDSLYTTCYMLCCQDWFFFTQQRKINCKEGREFVFILALQSRVPGWRRTAVGEGWPTRCLLPLPCLAAQSLWQNKPPGILGKHWEPLSGIRTISWEHHSQKASHFQCCLHFSL